jgi:hypothetical protein
MKHGDYKMCGYTTQILAITAAVIVLATSITNAKVLFNYDLPNTTGQAANDYHIKMEANENIDIIKTYEIGGDEQFANAMFDGVEGNGTKVVTINWHHIPGYTVDQGQTTHIGAGIEGEEEEENPAGWRITESWWTFDGEKLTSPTSGRLATVVFNGTISDNWLTVKIELYDDILGTNLIGTGWIEGRGTDATISNQTTGGSIYARWAFNTPTSTMIPLEELNESLGDFGPFTPIVELRPRDIPTVSEWGLIVMALLLVTVGGFVIVRRSKTKLA